MIATIIASVVIVLIVGLATAYIIREKRRGAACIGCPASHTCSSKNCGSCACCKDKDTQA